MTLTSRLSPRPPFSRIDFGLAALCPWLAMILCGVIFHWTPQAWSGSAFRAMVLSFVYGAVYFVWWRIDGAIDPREHMDAEHRPWGLMALYCDLRATIFFPSLLMTAATFAMAPTMRALPVVGGLLIVTTALSAWMIWHSRKREAFYNHERNVFVADVIASQGLVYSVTIGEGDKHLPLNVALDEEGHPFDAWVVRVDGLSLRGKRLDETVEAFVRKFLMPNPTILAARVIHKRGIFSDGRKRHEARTLWEEGTTLEFLGDPPPREPAPSVAIES